MRMRLRTICAVAGMAFGLMAVTAAPMAETARSDIYDASADPRADIAAALNQARREDKRVLLHYGANWCSWCHLLHAHFAEVEDVKAILDEHYIVVLVDNDAHPEVATGYGTDASSLPYLSVLDADGNKLTDQDTGLLQTGSEHDPVKVAEFLNRWAPGETSDAEAALDGALRQASAEGKKVFIHFGTQTCGWCRRLEEFIALDGAAPLHDAYVFLKVKQDREPGAVALRERLSSGNGGGVPWYAVLAPNGDVAATSNRNEENTGYPVDPHEIAHFMNVIDTTTDLDDATVASIKEALKARARELRSR